jgi:hypothetical protein
MQLPQPLPHVTAKLPQSSMQARPQWRMILQKDAGVRHMASELPPTAPRQFGENTVQMGPWRDAGLLRTARSPARDLWDSALSDRLTRLQILLLNLLEPSSPPS